MVPPQAHVDPFLGVLPEPCPCALLAAPVFLDLAQQTLDPRPLLRPGFDQVSGCLYVWVRVGVGVLSLPAPEHCVETWRLARLPVSLRRRRRKVARGGGGDSDSAILKRGGGMSGGGTQGRVEASALARTSHQSVRSRNMGFSTPAMKPRT